MHVACLLDTPMLHRINRGVQLLLIQFYGRQIKMIIVRELASISPIAWSILNVGCRVDKLSEFYFCFHILRLQSLSLCCYNWWLCLPWFYLCPRPNSKYGLLLFTALFSSQKGFMSLYIFALSCLYPFDSLHPGSESSRVLQPKDLHEPVKGCSKAPWSLMGRKHSGYICCKSL